jgi:hypothetical protein
MSGCAVRRWGTGSGYVKCGDTAASKELDARLKAVMAERERQDSYFTGVVPEVSASASEPVPAKEPVKKEANK